MTQAIRVIVATCLLCAVRANAAETLSAEQLEFFEKQVRPLLVQHCHECHGAKKQEGGLRLDTNAGLLKGSDSGAVIVPGNIDGSRLIRVLRYVDGETQMPPKGKLPDDQIAIVRKWLELGTPWPPEADSVGNTGSAKPHWAFQPIKRPEIPPVSKAIASSDGGAKAASAPETPIDSFIAAALAEKYLTISRPAARYTFIRRVTFDLWGLPPTFDQVHEFESDPSPDAIERAVDRLLASPLYGQRWGRHWLDVARYADSKGYVFTAEPRYPYSYTYRDYVVDALNSDKPFNKFVVEQLAADLAIDDEKRTHGPTESHDPRLAAMGFLTVGRRYLNNNNDIIDDRIDVVSRGLLGLTVGCARCHDHKFDPIPTADYYSLYGIFSSSTEPEDLPLIGDSKDALAYQAFQSELANREAAVANYEKESVPKIMNEIRDVAGDVLQQIAKQSPTWSKAPVVFAGANEPRKPIVKRWQDYLSRTVTRPDPVLGPWNTLAKVARAEDLSVEVARMIESWSSETEATKVNPLVRQAIVEQPPCTLQDLGVIYGKLFREVNGQWTALHASMPDAKQLPDGAAEQLRQILYGEGSPATVTIDEARQLFGRDIRDMITNLKRKADNLKVTSPGAPPRAMVVRDAQIQEPVIFVRGNPGRQGKRVPRQFLEVVSGPDRKAFTQGSGRLELAEAIVNPRNPLTSRVIANRVWQHHFATGLVPTPSDFGTRGLPPSHPQLLDWLAAEMIAIDRSPTVTDSPNQWSLKRLHRLIVNSSVYRQSSTEDANARERDPENRLLWQMPRQRLDFESLRDSLLAVSGKLDNTIGGQPFDGVTNPATTRRTIYAMINRNDLPGVFRAFDFADTDSSAAERPQTTVPQQSLFVMNSPFVLEQARRLAAECHSAASEDSARLDRLFQRVFSRPATEDEKAMGLQYLSAALTTATEKRSPWDRLAQILLMTNEFSFVD